MKYTQKNIEKYLVHINYFGQDIVNVATPENEYDFEQEQILVDRCKAGCTLSILESIAKEVE